MAPKRVDVEINEGYQGIASKGRGNEIASEDGWKPRRKCPFPVRLFVLVVGEL